MKCYKFCIALLVCVVLTANPIESELLDQDTAINVYNAAIPALSGLVGMCVTAVPVGPILVGGLGLIHVATMILAGGGNDEENKALSSLDLMKSQSVINGAIENIGYQIKEESQRIINELTNVIESTWIMGDMRNTLASIRRSYADKMKVIMNPKATGLQKNTIILSMLDLDSPFMDKLRSFIDKFIKPSVSMPASSAAKLFFELTLQNDALLAAKNEDSYTDSLHSKIFKSYMIIVKALTDGYVMPIIAHTIQYQKELQNGQLSDAQTTKNNAETLIEDYKSDMKTLIDQTKLALNMAPREIRNSGSLKLINGNTFERLSFAQIIPRIMNPDINGCSEEEATLNLKDFEIGNCNTYADILPPNSQLSIFKKPEDLDRPYQYMNVISPDGSKDVFGHNSSDSNLIEQQTTISDMCPTVFCPAFKKNAVAISTQRLRAELGNVITGLRFRVEDRVLYIDIQQGKFLDIISVDPATVYWTKTPAGGPVTYLSSSVRKIELGNFEVEGKNFLKSIQLRPGSGRNAGIYVFVEGAKAPNWYTFGGSGSINSIPESNELQIPVADDPEMADENSKYLISPPPKEGERYFVTIEPSDFKKDMGRSTVPFVDKREVVSNPPAPLSGFGIYHETSSTSGGFIALKLITPKLDDLADYKQIESFTEAIKQA